MDDQARGPSARERLAGVEVLLEEWHAVLKASGREFVDSTMRRDTIITAAILAGVPAFFVTFLIGIAVTSTWQCDGVCASLELFLVSVAVGAFCAVAAAWIAWERVTRQPGDD